jgi:hypothetical protein
MRDLPIVAIHLLVTVAKLLLPGGVRAVATESPRLKHQLLISNRCRHRAPKLTTRDRLMLGLCALFVSRRRIPKLGAVVKPATLLKFHQALVDRKYRRLFSSRYRRLRVCAYSRSRQLWRGLRNEPPQCQLSPGEGWQR